MDRRDFIKQSLLIGALFSWGAPYVPWFPGPRAGEPDSVVVQVRDSSVRKGIHFDEARLSAMLEEALAILYSSNKAESIWTNLFSRDDVVGIKVNCLSGRRGSSHPELVNAVIEALRRTGLPAGNIVIWDRLNADLESAGYRINIKNRNKVRCFGNDAAGYSNRLYLNGSVGSLLTRTVTDYCSAIINIPVLKDHGIVGVTMAMKNFFGAIHNPNKYHVHTGNPFVADLYEMDILRKKVRLTILDALDAQYEGGPPYKPQWVWPLNSLLVSLDAVALDRVGWELIEKTRKDNDFPTLKEAGREPVYIMTAGKKGIGCSQLDKIKWIRAGEKI